MLPSPMLGTSAIGLVSSDGAVAQTITAVIAATPAAPNTTSATRAEVLADDTRLVALVTWSRAQWSIEPAPQSRLASLFFERAWRPKNVPPPAAPSATPPITRA